MEKKRKKMENPNNATRIFPSFLLEAETAHQHVNAHPKKHIPGRLDRVQGYVGSGWGALQFLKAIQVEKSGQELEIPWDLLLKPASSSGPRKCTTVWKLTAAVGCERIVLSSGSAHFSRSRPEQN